MTQKKSVASSNADIVSVLPRKEKVDLLAQALLREYMHRRGFRKTLTEFDTECPRAANTISSRQLMSDLMALTKIQERAKRLGSSSATGTSAGGGASSATSAAPPLSTFMEMLCSYRLRKRALNARRKAENDGATATAKASGVSGEGGGEKDAAAAAAADAMSDSSADEWKDLQCIAEKRRIIREREAACAQETTIFEKRIAQLRQTLAELRQMEARLTKRIAAAASAGAVGDGATEDSLDVSGKPKKKKNQNKEGSVAALPSENGASSDPTRTEPNAADAGVVAQGKASHKKKTKDALKDAMQLVSALPTTSSSGSGTPRGGVGRNWTPGGSAAAIPEVGVGRSSSSSGGSGEGGGAGGTASGGLFPVSDKPPSFVAGDGFHLMADRLHLRTSGGPPPKWPAEAEKPPRGPSNFSSANAAAMGLPSQPNNSNQLLPRDGSASRVSDGSDDEVPSPYRLGKTVYDHRLTAPSILANRSDNMKENAGVSFVDGTASGVIRMKASPTAAAATVTTSSNAGAAEDSGLSGVNTSSRKTRRVTILE